MSNETDLEFQILLASLTGNSIVNSDNWELKVNETNIAGKVFIKPFEKSKFICIEVENFDSDILIAKLKPIVEIVEETGITEFDETSGNEMEQRMFIFLTYYPNYSEKIDVNLRKQLKTKL